jgi:hypothetical protein
MILAHYSIVIQDQLLFVEVQRFTLATSRTQKYITCVKDRRFPDQRQLSIISNIIDDENRVYATEYATLESSYDMGFYDVSFDGAEGVLLFFPTKSIINDFDICTLFI